MRNDIAEIGRVLFIERMQAVTSTLKNSDSQTMWRMLGAVLDCLNEGERRSLRDNFMKVGARPDSWIKRNEVSGLGVGPSDVL